MHDSGLPADVLVGKLNKDISFALRRGTSAQVTTPHHHHHHHHALDGFAWLRLASPGFAWLRLATPAQRALAHALNRRAAGDGRRAGGLGS
jgi:hypothetical protein